MPRRISRTFVIKYESNFHIDTAWPSSPGIFVWDLALSVLVHSLCVKGDILVRRKSRQAISTCRWKQVLRRRDLQNPAALPREMHSAESAPKGLKSYGLTVGKCRIFNLFVCRSKPQVGLHLASNQTQKTGIVIIVLSSKTKKELIKDGCKSKIRNSLEMTVRLYSNVENFLVQRERVDLLLPRFSWRIWVSNSSKSLHTYCWHVGKYLFEDSVVYHRG